MKFEVKGDLIGHSPTFSQPSVLCGRIKRIYLLSCYSHRACLNESIGKPRNPAIHTGCWVAASAQDQPDNDKRFESRPLGDNKMGLTLSAENIMKA